MFLLGALFGLVLKLATDAYGEDFASTPVRRWHELTLGGLPPKEREFKLAELDSYLFEQAQADRARGYKPAEVGCGRLGGCCAVCAPISAQNSFACRASSHYYCRRSVCHRWDAAFTRMPQWLLLLRFWRGHWHSPLRRLRLVAGGNR
jgi:hypothetical protein